MEKSPIPLPAYAGVAILAAATLCLESALTRLLADASAPGRPAQLDIALAVDHAGADAHSVLLLKGLAALQAKRGDREPVPITLTLPAAAGSGFTAAGKRMLGRTLDAGVRVATVVADVVGPADHTRRAASTGMGTLAIRTAQRAHDDLIDVYAERGKQLPAAKAWHLLGLRVSIGENRSGPGMARRVVTVADAVEISRFTREMRGRGTPLGLISMWSFNRDHRCGARGAANVVSGAQWAQPQPQCNLAGSELQFAKLLSR
jgi:hypothetical protein